VSYLQKSRWKKALEQHADGLTSVGACRQCAPGLLRNQGNPLANGYWPKHPRNGKIGARDFGTRLVPFGE